MTLSDLSEPNSDTATAATASAAGGELSLAMTMRG
jgi:hypothetical protein